MVRKSPISRNTRAALPFIGAGILAAATAAICQAQAIPRITGSVENSPLVSLSGEVHPWARPQFDRGLAPANVSGRMLLVLRRSAAQESALQTLLAAQQDPNSPNYQKWITPEQFGKQFGVADADVQTVTGYLASRGLGVGRVYGNHMAIEVSATAEQMSSTFQTEIHTYSVGGKTYYANASAPKIPSALKTVVAGFASINNFRSPVGVNAGTQASFNPETHTLSPLYTLPGRTTFGVSPGDLAKIYTIPAATAQGLGGQNVAVGILGDSNINVSYINNYRSIFNLGVNPPVIVVDGNDPGMNDDAYIAYKQIELVGAVAPNATVYYYTSATTDYDIGLNFALIRAVMDNKVQILLNGYQQCESAMGDEMLLFNLAAEQAAAQGITVVAAAGNTGPAACEIPGSATAATTAFAVNGYASSPFVTAVGGTDFNYTTATTNYWTNTNTATYTSARKYIPEQAWNDSNTNQGPSVLLAGGGGVSTVGLDGATTPQPIPSYQSANAQASAISATARIIPDVSFFAGSGANNTLGYNNTAYMFCMQAADCVGSTPQFTYSGGTEASSAVFAGAMALLVNRINSGSPYGLGNVNPVLYSRIPTNKIVHTDTPAGSSNALACSSGPNCSGGVMTGYNTGAGYDAATGLGSFNITSFVSNFAPANTTASNVALTVLDATTGKPPVCGTTPNCIVHSTTMKFVVNATSASGTGKTPTGDVTLLSSSPLASQQAVASVMTLSAGTATNPYYKTLPGGSYNLYARYAGDGTYAPSVSAPYPITVLPEACKMVVYANNTGGTITYGTPVTITAEPYSTTGANNVAIPSGSLNVIDNGNIITMLPFNSEGAATFSSNLLAFGPHIISIAFPGDASFSACQTPNYTVTIAKAATTTTLNPANADVAYGNVAMTALVQSASLPNNGTSPTGTVVFSSDPTHPVPLVPGFDPNGNAIATANTIVNANQIQNKQVTATYKPGTAEKNYTGSSTTVNVTSSGSLFGNNPTATTFSISDTYNTTNSIYPAQDSLTLNIQISSNSGGFNPQGCGALSFLCTQPTVSIYADGILLASGLTTQADGTIQYVLPQQNGYLALPSGETQFNVIFTGYKQLFGLFTQYNASSAFQTITISDDRTSADFALQSANTVNPNPLISTGSMQPPQASYNLRLTSIYNFQSAYNATPINLSCSVIAYTNTSGVRSTPAGLGCGFDTSLLSNTTSVSFANNSVAPGFIGATLYVGAASTYSIAGNTLPASGWWLATGGTTLACLFLFGLPSRRRNWQSLLGACVMVIVSFGMTGCGAPFAASNSSQQSTNNLKSGSAGASDAGGTPVPTGTYTVLVTASSTTNTSVVHTLPVQVIVGSVN